MILLNWLLAFWLTLLPSPAAFTLSTLYAGGAANDSSFGTTSWSTPLNATGANDNNFASTTSSTAGQNSNYLKVSAYGFTIPAGATINGVQVSIRNNCLIGGSGTVDWARVRLVNESGTIGSTDKATGSLTPFTGATAVFGGSADTWSSEASVIDWNDTDAGVAMAVNFNGIDASTSGYVDFVQVAITYTQTAPFSPRRTVIGQARKLTIEKQGVSF